MLSKEHWLFI